MQLKVVFIYTVYIYIYLFTCIYLFSLLFLFILSQFPCQLLENVPETVVHVLISMMNVQPTGNAAHSTTVTAHVQLTTVSFCHKHPKSVPQLPL